MPTCSKCHPVYDLGRICPHQGPGRDVWQQGWDTGYVEGINAAHLGFAEPPPERRILLDLIAEMRARHYEHTFPAVGGHPAVEGVCATCEVDCAYADWPCAHSLMADRAEARLREVGGG